MKIKIFGDADNRTLEQLERCTVHADYAVLCADNHVGYSQSIGAAIAYNNYISPSGVGFDIACGNKAVLTNLLVNDINISRIMDRVLEILGAKVLEEVHNHHNFAWEETHFGKKYWVIRKGCTPAFPNQKCFVGNTMAGSSVVLEGIDSVLSRQALYTTVHGAGRIMSRTKAAGRFRYKKGKRVQVEKGAVDFSQVKRKASRMGIELRGGGPDEAPEVYKDLLEVLEHHKGTVKILYKLKPVGVAMAGLDSLFY